MDNIKQRGAVPSERASTQLIIDRDSLISDSPLKSTRMLAGSVLKSTTSSARTDNPLDFRIPKKQTAPIDKAALVIGLIDQRLGDLPMDQTQ